MDCQDWTPVVLHRSKRADESKAKTHRPARSEEAARVARVEAKVDEGIQAPKKFLSPESVTAVQAYRRENELTQRQLDARLSWPANIVNGLEARRYTPTSQQLGQLSKLLHTTLRLSEH